jgi:hypothetical protein
MSLHRRLERLERVRKAHRFAVIPWALGYNNEAQGVEIDGVFRVWDEIAERHPEAPRPLG